MRIFHPTESKIREEFEKEDEIVVFLQKFDDIRTEDDVPIFHIDEFPPTRKTGPLER